MKAVVQAKAAPQARQMKAVVPAKASTPVPAKAQPVKPVIPAKAAPQARQVKATVPAKAAPQQMKAVKQHNQ